MKILILEDNQEKKDKILGCINDAGDIDITDVSTNFADFTAKTEKTKYDLIIVDLMVPPVSNYAVIDITENLNNLRNYDAKNRSTPILALTAFARLADERYQLLNQLDINVLNYQDDTDCWVEPFMTKVETCRPLPHFDFLIFCALDKEADAYQQLGFNVGRLSNIHGIKYKSISIDAHKGAIIIPPRMGLVNSAIVCSRAIDLFTPKLLGMSGICAGVEGKVNIYDVVISDYCFQHDSGKWSEGKFVHEPYSVQLEHLTSLCINQTIADPSFISFVKDGISFQKEEEKPLGKQDLEFDVLMGPTSSGSAVVADTTTLEDIKKSHRKITAFEMESYALYESCRQALSTPRYFSAKCVVDCGDENKSDEFHRIACLLSAKSTYGLVKELMKLV